jgi:phenylacetate-CoA ligase
VSETELNSKQIKKIETAIALYLEPNLNFSFIRKKALERSNRGKLKQFKSFI